MSENKTDWAALRALKTAVGSLPPVEPNTDRAQMASLGQSAGAPVGGAEGPLAGANAEGLLPCPFCGGEARLIDDELSMRLWVECRECRCASPMESTGVCVDAWNRRTDNTAAACDLARGLNIERTELAYQVRDLTSQLTTAQASGLNLWQKNRQLEQIARLGVTLASSFLTWEMGSGAADHATDDARMATCRALAKRIWHERGEVRPLDVERLVEAICQMVEVSDVLKVEDESLRLAYANAYMEPLGRADAKPAAIRALVLAALFGDATTTRPEGPQQPAGSEARMWVVCNFCVGTFDPAGKQDPHTRLWTCPHCGATYDETELNELEAFADGPDCAPGFNEEARNG